MKKMFLMAVAAMMATMTFAQAYEWKLLSSINPEDFVNVSEEEGKAAAIELGQNCIYSSDGEYCWFTDGIYRTNDTWSTIEVLTQYGYIYYYPAAPDPTAPEDADPEAAEPEAIDLGLSVKWANFNIGATKPEEYGDYFAWGETESKETFTAENYTYSDNPTVLPASADAATQIWGGEWRMPTSDDINELIDDCKWDWTTENGITGYRITSFKSGYSDKSIFLPATGRYEENLISVGSEARYWISTRQGEMAKNLYAYSYIQMINTGNRYMGLTIRPVCAKSIAPTALEDTNADANADRKVMRNGQLIIIRDGVTYDAQGAIVK